MFVYMYYMIICVVYIVYIYLGYKFIIHINYSHPTSLIFEHSACRE